ncbi:MAG: cation transporter [Clostridia bacterium]|nr:cation transporter [Clostridia bacterium]
MAELLARLFVRNYKNTDDAAVRRAYGTMVSIIGIALNALLSGMKLAIGILTMSVSIQADAVNNLSDAGSSLISLICFRLSAKPADRDHPYGHARLEYVASMIVSFFILYVGVDLLWSSAKTLYTSIVTPEAATHVAFSWVAALILLASIVGKLFLAYLNHRIGKKLRSTVMRAAMTDSLSDVLSTTAVLVATVVAHFVALPFSLDGAMGIVVSVLILIAGWKILWETQNSILGEAPPEEIVRKIEALVMKSPVALGMHDLAVHQYGTNTVIASLHVEVDGAADTFDAHDAIDNIERELWDVLHVRATIHLDPIVIGDPVVDALRAEAELAVRSVDARITLHDFRAVCGTTHCNLIFDIAVPFECKQTDKELVAQIGEAITREHPAHFAVISVDRV